METRRSVSRGVIVERRGVGGPQGGPCLRRLTVLGPCGHTWGAVGTGIQGGVRDAHLVRCVFSVWSVTAENGLTVGVEILNHCIKPPKTGRDSNTDKARGRRWALSRAVNWFANTGGTPGARRTRLPSTHGSDLQVYDGGGGGVACMPAAGLGALCRGGDPGEGNQSEGAGSRAWVWVVGGGRSLQEGVCAAVSDKILMN